MSITIKDVANHAGVSRSTVSQYLNKRFQYMSVATRERIAASIAELNYQPNQIAKSLKQKQTHVIAFVCATLESRFTIKVTAVIEKYFQKLGYTVLVASTEDDSIRERQLIESFIARQVDGIIVFPTAANKEFYQQLVKQHYPLVFLDRKISDIDVPMVLLDNELAGQIATAHLIANGHQKIAMLTLPIQADITPRVGRITGYQNQLAQQKIKFKPEFLIETHLNQVGDKLQTLFTQANKPTAIILSNDMLLEQALLWIKEQGVDIPHDFAIVGIDDVSFAKFFNPTITTIQQPITAMGTKAATLLHMQLTNPQVDELNKAYYFKPELLTRESSIFK